MPAPDYTPAPELNRSTPLQIIFTSGTTSEPKGIVHTHGNVLASLDPIEREIARYRRYERPFHPLRFLHTLPLSHVFGQFMGLWVPPLLAAEVHFESRLDAPRLIQLFRGHRISVLAAVPRVLELLRSHLTQLDPSLATRLDAASQVSALGRWWRFRRQHRLFGWKFWAFVCGGATLPEELEQFWTRLGFALIQGYGMTETTALVTLNHPFHTARGSIGRPLAGREVRVAEDGEILVRGGSIAETEWHSGRAQRRTADEGWLRTGDLAARNAEGELVFAGRKSDIIVQFLTEAVVLTVMGGVLGLLLGWTISRAAGLVFPNLPTAVPLWAAASGVAVSVGVGLFFGIWPASRAARLDPVEALRHE